jgi:hypothetical protein
MPLRLQRLIFIQKQNFNGEDEMGYRPTGNKDQGVNPKIVEWHATLLLKYLWVSGQVSIRFKNISIGGKSIVSNALFRLIDSPFYLPLLNFLNILSFVS